MKKLFGYVLVKETNVGIPNLVVAAFDARDCAARIEERQSAGSVLHQAGRRLGSVLTDQNGMFTIASDDLEFQGNEARPNLIVAVFAPEDIESIERPVALPLEKRILFMSSAPRLDAGAEEAFVIRILQAQVDRFEIGLPPEVQHGIDASSRLGDAIESAWNSSAYLRDRFKGRIKTQVDAVRDRKKESKRALKNLSAIPLHLRDADGKPNPLQNNTLLIQSRRDLPSKLPDLQTKSLKDGLKRLHHREDKPLIRLYVTKAELSRMGLHPDDKERASAKVSSLLVTSKVRNSMRGFDLIKVRGLNNPPPAELRRRYLPPAPPANAAAATPEKAVTTAPGTADQGSDSLTGKRADTRKTPTK